MSAGRRRRSSTRAREIAASASRSAHARRRSTRRRLARRQAPRVPPTRRLELRAGGDRLLQQQPVEIASQHRAAGQPPGYRALDCDAVLARDDHAVDAQAALLDRRRRRRGAAASRAFRIDGVAAQLVARETSRDRRSARARRRARAPCAGHRAGRPRADDQNVIIGHARPMTMRAVLRSEAEAVAERGADLGARALRWG